VPHRPHRVVERLRAAGCVFAEEEATLLLEAADRSAELEALLQRRLSGVPLEHVLGWAEFAGLRISLDPGVFVPRRRSELLVVEAVARSAADAVVVDLCCGSGALGAAVANRRSDLSVYAADLDPLAVACARRNLPADRVFQGDLFDALPDRLRGHVGVLLVNAPYVPSAELAFMPREARDFESPVALDGGPDGLGVQRRVIADAPDWLGASGHLIMETSRAQAPSLLEAFSAGGLTGSLRQSADLDAVVAIASRSAGPVS
jgi:release factor glutamine methyltransferase